VNFGVGTMGRQISGNGVQLMFYAIDALRQIRLCAVNLFRQHLPAFNDQVKLVLNRFGKAPNAAGDHAVYIFRVFFVASIVEFRIIFWGQSWAATIILSRGNMGTGENE